MPDGFLFRHARLFPIPVMPDASFPRHARPDRASYHGGDTKVPFSGRRSLKSGGATSQLPINRVAAPPKIDPDARFPRLSCRRSYPFLRPKGISHRPGSPFGLIPPLRQACRPDCGPPVHEDTGVHASRWPTPFGLHNSHARLPSLPTVSPPSLPT